MRKRPKLSVANADKAALDATCFVAECGGSNYNEQQDNNSSSITYNANDYYFFNHHHHQQHQNINHYEPQNLIKQLDEVQPSGSLRDQLARDVSLKVKSTKLIEPATISSSSKSSLHKYRVDMDDFELLKVLGTGAYGQVFLVRKLTGHDKGKLYAMKVLRKEIVAQKTKTLDHTRTERKVLEAIRNVPFLVTMHYAFQTRTKLHLILDYINGGELFTHLYQRDHFKEDDVKIYIGELILALEKLHMVSCVDYYFEKLFVVVVVVVFK